MYMRERDMMMMMDGVLNGVSSTICIQNIPIDV